MKIAYLELGTLTFRQQIEAQMPSASGLSVRAMLISSVIEMGERLFARQKQLQRTGMSTNMCTVSMHGRSPVKMSTLPILDFIQRLHPQASRFLF